MWLKDMTNRQCNILVSLTAIVFAAMAFVAAQYEAELIAMNDTYVSLLGIIFILPFISAYYFINLRYESLKHDEFMQLAFLKRSFYAAMFSITFFIVKGFTELYKGDVGAHGYVAPTLMWYGYWLFSGYLGSHEQ
jgi:hypothetical protein